MAPASVLLADDQTLYRDGLRRVISDLDASLSICEAATFGEVLLAVELEKALRLAVLDWAIPGMEGPKGLALLRQAAPALPVVVLSSSSRGQDAKAALTAGAAGYVPKTASAQVLLGALNLILAGGVYLPPLLLDARPGADTVIATAEDGLTRRQREVLVLLSEGKTNRQIAHALGLSEGTVKLHVAAVFKTLNVRSRTQAVMLATRRGLLPEFAGQRSFGRA